jgi:uncharacterized protein (DUF924 family)
MDRELIDFWFSAEVSKLWYNSTPVFDQQLREGYLDLWQQASQGELQHWQETALSSLALVILLDQFPLNMFRGSAQCYSSEARSREVACAAIDRGFDRELAAEQCSFMYMPFMHSEDIEDQRLAIKLFSQPGLESNLRFAKHHHGIIEKFGRFPHRNAVLGRDNTDAEIEYLNSKQAFKG